MIDTLQPFAYQRVGIAALSRGSLLLADDPGLGKMVQALCAMDARDFTLVVCPKSVADEWVSEGQRWRPDLLFVLWSELGALPMGWLSPKDSGLGSTVRITRGVVCVCWPQSMPTAWHVGSLPWPLTVCVDEPHMHRKLYTTYSQGIGSWVRFARRVWGLDGTPIYNRVSDMWTILCLLGLGKRFGGKRAFEESVKLASLYDDLKRMGVMVRRTLDEVKGDVRLPPLTQTICKLPWPGYAQALANGQRPADMNASHVRMYSGELKARALPSLLSSLGVQPPCVIWAVHQRNAELACEVMMRDVEDPATFIAPRCVTGRMTLSGRAETFAAFQRGDFPFLITTHCANMGVRLTRARSTVIMEVPWETRAMKQAIARMWRIGQGHPVNVYHLLFDHWSDEHASGLVSDKEAAIVRTNF